MKEIISYLKKTYDPLAIICYGSYADGSNNEHSDFDALVITREHPEYHDTAVVCGTRLDVFVYPAAAFAGSFDCEGIMQIFDGYIALDTDGLAASIMGRVREHIASMPRKTPDEALDELAWCEKMLLRAARQDAEGLFRLHWLLVDSLEIFCDAMGRPYLGPKKSLRLMEREHPQAFACYTRALAEGSAAAAEAWIGEIRKSL